MKTGDKVVCVDDSQKPCGCVQPLILNNVYVVDEVSDFKDRNGQFGIRIIGLYPEHSVECRFVSCGFNRASRFRLLSELKEEARQRNQQTVAL